MSIQKLRTGLCIYCGQKGILSRDHVPPKTLFADPRPSNLISVPSCTTCNAGASLDDEYFRLVHTLRIDIFTHPDAFRNWKSVKRSLYNPQKENFKQVFLNTLQKINIYTKEGIFISETGIYEVDIQRIKRVVERTVKGLFYHEMKTRLSDNYEVTVFSSSEMTYFPSDVHNFLESEVFPLLISIKPKVIGRNVFSYRSFFADNDTNLSVWLLIFYKTEAFLCWTLPTLPTPDA